MEKKSERIYYVLLFKAIIHLLNRRGLLSDDELDRIEMEIIAEPN